MTQRIFALTSYLLRTFVSSLNGGIFLVLSLLYWYIFFPPSQGTPDVDNYIILIGVWGAVLSFLITLSVASRANEAGNTPFVVRLPSRVEYMTAVLLASMVITFALQFLVALLASFEGPDIPFGRALEIPPIWVAINILFMVLALHATDLVTAEWSRVYIFSTLAVLLILQNQYEAAGQWLANRLYDASSFFLQFNLFVVSDGLRDAGRWLNTGDNMESLFSFAFWPLQSIAEATIAGVFTPTQALAPAVLLLYATILFMLAADVFATKDLDLVE